MNDLISRKALLAEYDRLHIGEPGKARKLIEDAPRVDAVDLPHWATERSYKNGYEQGKKDALAKDNNVPSKWIPVSERLPECGKKVLATKMGADSRFVFYGKHLHGSWLDLEWSCYRYGVTHWMPLPEPPKGE